MKPVRDSTPAFPPSVSSQLSVRRGQLAVEFYIAAFGAEEVYRVGGTEDEPGLVCQLLIGSSLFSVTDESPLNRHYSPESLGGTTVRLLLIVENPRDTVKRAIAVGAREITPVGESGGWLLGRIEDPFGHQWEIGRPLTA